MTNSDVVGPLIFKNQRGLSQKMRGPNFNRSWENQWHQS
jgi:hypothetical protein